MNIASYIDHTQLKATATRDEILTLCEEAKTHGFFSVCVHSSWVFLAKEAVKGTDVKVCSVIGFPLGAMAKDAKIYEAKTAVQAGADEIDMVMNIGFLKSGMYEEVKDEILHIKQAIGNKVLKVIIETCVLTNDEKIKACQLSIEAGADFVKTSTGFGSAGANLEDTALMLDVVKGRAFVKASGGVRDFETAKAYIEQGVMRLGTSNGIIILKGLEAKNTY